LFVVLPLPCETDEQPLPKRSFSSTSAAVVSADPLAAPSNAMPNVVLPRDVPMRELNPPTYLDYERSGGGGDVRAVMEGKGEKER
jgi:hypothetical protein